MQFPSAGSCLFSKVSNHNGMAPHRFNGAFPFTRPFPIHHSLNPVTCVVARLVFICVLQVRNLGMAGSGAMVAGHSWLVAGGET